MPEQQAKVADPGGDEGLLGRRGRCGPLIPEADQQVRREPHHLPAHKQQQQAIGDQQAEHGPGKKREKAEKPGEVFVVVHIRHAVNENQQADEGHHDQHDCCQRVQHPSQLHPFRSELHPGKVDKDPLRLPQQMNKGNHRKHKRKTDGGDRDGGRESALLSFEERTDARGQQG